MSRTLRILRDAYPGDATRFRAEFIGGMGLVCQRYNGALDDAEVIRRLQTAVGGAAGIRHKAAGLKLKTGRYLSECVAAAFVETVNTGRGGKKLPSWWA